MKEYVLKNFILLNGHKDMTPQKGFNIVVKDRKIVRITKDEIHGLQTIDLNGQYLMPGLIDLHIHLPGSGGYKIGKDAKGLIKLVKKYWIFRQIGLLICKKNAKAELFGGTTTARCVGGVGDLDSTIRNQINSDKAIGPRLIVANEAITVKNGHMEGTVSVAFDSIEKIKEKVDSLLLEGVDIIKLMITGGVLDAKKRGEPGELKMPYEFIKAAVDAAHEKGLKVAAHIEGPEGIHLAVKAGVDTIEHGSTILPEDLKEMKEKKLALVITLSPAVPLSCLDPTIFGFNDDTTYNTNVLINRMIATGKLCLDNDIPVGYGTDSGCPLVRHYNTYLEGVYLNKYFNFTNQEALYSITLNNAKVLLIDGITGSIDVGKSADMIVTKENPLENLKALKDVQTVIVRGKVYKNIKVKRDPKVEELLDNCL